MHAKMLTLVIYNLVCPQRVILLGGVETANSMQHIQGGREEQHTGICTAASPAAKSSVRSSIAGSAVCEAVPDG